jgi:hypothetical protein
LNAVLPPTADVYSTAVVGIRRNVHAPETALLIFFSFGTIPNEPRFHENVEWAMVMYAAIYLQHAHLY